MELTVDQLIEQLQAIEDKTLPVKISFVGITSQDSWESYLTLEEYTVDVYNNTCRINFSN